MIGISSRLQFGFLANVVKVFPSLKTRPLHLTGESYAGTYIVSRQVRIENHTGAHDLSDSSSRTLRRLILVLKTRL